MVTPTRICVNPTCSRAGERQPWSNFYAAAKWEDGTMRRPQSRCKTCHGAAVRANREPQRKYDRKRYRRIRKDPVAWADRLEEMRFQYRGRRGVSHLSCRKHDKQLLPAGPFAAWLREVIDREGATIIETSRRLGISDRTMRQVMKGRRAHVELETVEQALIADDTTTLREVYSEWFEEAA